MWLFGRKAKTPTPAPPTDAAAPQGPRLVRRTEIIVEREWTSTSVRRPGPDPKRSPGSPGLKKQS